MALAATLLGVFGTGYEIIKEEAIYLPAGADDQHLTIPRWSLEALGISVDINSLNNLGAAFSMKMAR